MPDGEEPRKHITEALGGRYVAPSDEERVERERVRNLIQAVLSCYRALVSQEADETRRAELQAEEALYTEESRRQISMSAAERQEVLRTYPDLLARLRADLS
ncbi:hypothetical protein ACFWUU_36150 [Kribbella sp. NPDC058693]|uniref:hypothetical protein n=1 Tax=Kribbella sp. NPDC058693 TaxID=3346602 RepID=UPI0036502E1D